MTAAENLLKDHLSELHRVLLRLNVSMADAAPESIQKFLQKNFNEQAQILNNIAKYTRVLAHEPLRENDVPVTGRNNIESVRLKRALATFGMHALDSEIFKMISEDDVVEVYSDLGVQLYRNLYFCKLCSYSLFDLSVNTWDELYEKPAAITQAIHARVSEVLTTANKTLEYGLGTFIQKEKFIHSKTLRTFLVTPKFISPLIDFTTDQRIGFLSTYSAKILTEGLESLKYDIL